MNKRVDLGHKCSFTIKSIIVIFLKYNLYIFCQSVHLGNLYVFIAGLSLSFFFLNKHNVTIDEKKTEWKVTKFLGRKAVIQLF